MKKEMIDIMELFMEQIKKYGFLICLGMGLYFSFKKAWFWLIMPFLFLTTMKQLALLFDWSWVAQFNPFYLVLSWIFVFYSLKRIGNIMFEKVEKQ